MIKIVNMSINRLKNIDIHFIYLVEKLKERSILFYFKCYECAFLKVYKIRGHEEFT